MFPLERTLLEVFLAGGSGPAETNRGTGHVWLFLTGFAVLFFFLFPLSSETAVYYYEDENGRVHITDTPTHDGFRIVTPTAKEQLGVRMKSEKLIVGDRKKQRTGEELFDEAYEHSLYEVDDTLYAKEINEAARLFDVDPAMVKAIIKVESDFNPRCVSKAGARGLMQLMPATAASLGVVDPFDPRENIFGGTRYYREMLDRFKNVELALAAYNAGPGRVSRAGNRIPDIRETQNYVRKVQWYYSYYSRNSKKIISVAELNKEALAEVKAGNYYDALRMFKRIVNIHPDFSEGYYNMGYIYAVTGQYTRAVASYRKAIEINPYMKEAYYNLAVTYEKRGLLENAIATWRQYVQYEIDSEKIALAERYIKELEDYLMANE